MMKTAQKFMPAITLSMFVGFIALVIIAALTANGMDTGPFETWLQTPIKDVKIIDMGYLLGIYFLVDYFSGRG